MTIAASFYSSPKGGTLRIEKIENGRRTFIREEFVVDRVDARRTAAKLNAQPWNF